MRAGRKLNILRTSLVALTIMGTPGTYAAGSADVTPTPEFLASALEYQWNGWGASIDVTFEYGRDTQEAITWQCRYIRTPDVEYKEQTADTGDVYRYSYDWSANEFRMLLSRARDGQLYGQVASWPLGMLETQETPDPVHFPLGGERLIDLIGRGTVSPQQERIDGSSCWRVSLPPGGLDSLTVWVDPAIGFCPRRVEQKFRWSRSVKPLEFRDYREIAPGVWYPMTLASKIINHPEGEVAVASRVTNIRIGEAFSRSELLVAFPSGIPVSDADTMTEFVQP